MNIKQLSSDLEEVMEYLWEKEEIDYAQHHGTYDHNHPEEMNQEHFFTRLVRINQFLGH